MTLLKKIKGNIKKIYFCFLGLFWISLIIYFRLIQEKNSYTLEELKTQVTTYIISINIVFTVCHLLLILYALYLIFIKVNDNKINNTNNILLLNKNMKTLKNIISYFIYKLYQIEKF